MLLRDSFLSINSRNEALSACFRAAQLRKGYFDGIPSYTVSGGVGFVGSLDGGVYAFSTPSRTTD